MSPMILIKKIRAKLSKPGAWSRAAGVAEREGERERERES